MREMARRVSGRGWEMAAMTLLVAGFGLAMASMMAAAAEVLSAALRAMIAAGYRAV